MLRGKKNTTRTLGCIIITAMILMMSQKGYCQIPDSLNDEQAKYLKGVLDHDYKRAQVWWYGWLSGYSAATVGQGIVYFASDNKTTRQDMALSAATTLVGAVGQLVMPLLPYPYHPDVGEGTREYYETVLKDLALREKAGRSWKIHAISGAVNLTSGLITWLGFKRTWVDGLENFALNTVISETQIWTQPVRAIKDYEEYLRQVESGVHPQAHYREKVWIIGASPGGISIKVIF